MADPQHEALRGEALEAFKARVAELQAQGKRLGPGDFFKLFSDETRKRGVYEGQNLGQLVGGTLKTVAPIGAALIPGIGPLAAGAIAAGGSAAGRALGGERFDPLGTLKAGVLGGAGSAALGGQGFKGIGPLFSGGGAGGAVQDLGHGLTTAAGGGGGIGSFLGRAGSGILDFIKQDPERALRLGLGGLGAFQAAKSQGRANELTNRALGPLFDGSANPFANVGIDEGNPYNRQPRRTGQRALAAELSR